jgi:hypothetical protein
MQYSSLGKALAPQSDCAATSISNRRDIVKYQLRSPAVNPTPHKITSCRFQPYEPLERKRSRIDGALWRGQPPTKNYTKFASHRHMYNIITQQAFQHALKHTHTTSRVRHYRIQFRTIGSINNVYQQEKTSQQSAEFPNE